MVTVLASVDFIQKIIFEFKFYNDDDFSASSVIDMESYLFFKKIITENKAHIYLNISEEKIEQYKTNPKDVEDDEKDIAYFISTFKHSKLYSNVDLYNRLIHCNEINIPICELPCFLLLDNVSEDICLKIEQYYGINCFSLKRLKVEEKYRKPLPFTINNTKDGLFEKLNLYAYNTLEFYDPYFITNSSVTESSIVNFEFIKRLKLNGLKKLLITIHSDLVSGKFQLNEFDKRKEIFEKHLQNFNTANKSELKLEITKKAKHDRFIFTNTMINMIGNSFNMNSETYLNTFPQIIYNDFYK